MMLGTKRKTMFICFYFLKNNSTFDLITLFYIKLFPAIKIQNFKFFMLIQCGKLSNYQQNLQKSNGMSDFNMHFRNIHLQNLVDENEELRRRVAKLTQIEGYVQLLVDKLQKAERKQHSIVSQNSLLRQQLRQLEVKYSQSENMHGDQMRYVFAQHDKIIQEKNVQLLQIKNYFEKENGRAAQLQSQCRNQKSHQQKLVGQYEQALLKYRNRVVQLERDLQIIFQSFQEEKLLHAKTKDSWINEANQFKIASKQMQMHLSQLNEQCMLLSSANNNLQHQNNAQHDYNQQLQSKFRYSEQENAANINRLNANIASLQEKLILKTTEAQNLQASNAALLSEVQNLKTVQLRLKSDNQIYITDNQKLIFLLEQSDKQNNHLREKHAELEDYSSAEIQKGRIDNLRLREENNVLTKNGSERQNYLSGKLIQLKQANATRNNLQIVYDQAQSQVTSLRGQLQIIQQNLIAEKKLSTQLQIERKQLNESVILLKQHSFNVEEMNKKIQKQNHQLSKSNHEMSRILSNPRELNKDYVQQIDKMLKNFHEERQQQNKRHWVEKQKLKEMYQYEFKQKEMQMMRQIALLQEELAKNTKFDILAERSFNKITTKTPTKNVSKI